VSFYVLIQHLAHPQISPDILRYPQAHTWKLEDIDSKVDQLAKKLGDPKAWFHDISWWIWRLYGGFGRRVAIATDGFASK
jgi:hypothetical protein